ncbi:hypothetical protein Vretifemale_10630 [Volvox reticuliferus]|nr:hypothetical protein Vretifemale_10630 [Volvox reticuliferus]
MACAYRMKLGKNRLYTTSLTSRHPTVTIAHEETSWILNASHIRTSLHSRRSVATLANSPESSPENARPGPSEVVRNLARRYYIVQNPALANQLYSKAVQEFTESAVLAYECGHNEADVDEQLGQLSEDDLRQLKDFDAAECLAMVCLVWITLMLSPQSLKRWATTAAVSECTLTQWRGFVAMIVNGYFERRMAWFPLDRLQLELSAVQGRSLPPELVAERARVVYTTLEQVYPQFAKD